MKHKGTRELGYKLYESVIDPTDVIKFGKRVNYENKLTQEEVMADHIKQIRQRADNSKVYSELKR